MAAGLTGYESLARYYDVLMADVPYRRWIKFIDSFARRTGKRRARILDAGCGTGTVAVGLARRGHRVTAFDQSAEMLALADAKARRAKVDLLLLQCDFNLWAGQYDVIISTCDGINHILSVQELVNFFRKASSGLSRGGFLLFDVNSPYKFARVLADNVFYWQVSGLHVVWTNRYQYPYNTAILNIFAQTEPGVFTHAKTEVIERCFKPATLVNYLRKSGFKRVCLFDNYKGPLRSARTDRITVVAQK